MNNNIEAIQARVASNEKVFKAGLAGHKGELAGHKAELEGHKSQVQGNFTATFAQMNADRKVAETDHKAIQERADADRKAASEHVDAIRCHLEDKIDASTASIKLFLVITAIFVVAIGFAITRTLGGL